MDKYKDVPKKPEYTYKGPAIGEPLGTVCVCGKWGVGGHRLGPEVTGPLDNL